MTFNIVITGRTILLCFRIFVYGLFGAMLSWNNIGIIENPMVFLEFLVVALVIDALGRVQGRNSW